MLEVLNHLISIDDECQKRLNQLKEKQENIEYLVNQELSKRKDEIKTKYKFKLDMRKNEYDMKLAETVQNIELEKNRQIEEIKIRYYAEKQNAIDKIVNAIVEEE